MTTDEPTSKVEQRADVQELQNALGVIAGFDIENDLVRQRALGDASFRATRLLFDEIVRFAGKLQALNWHELPVGPVSSVSGLAKNLLDILQQQVGDFTLQQADPITARDTIAQSLQSSFDQLRVTAIPLVGFLSWEAMNLDEMTAEIDRLGREASAKISDTLGQLDASKAEADRALEAIRGVAAAAGVELHAETFKARADNHESASWWWLAASVLSAVATVAAAIGLVALWDANGDISDASVLQVVAAKGVVLIVGLFLTTNLVRMYRSQTHLSVVNRHREDALRTFKAFAEGTDSQEIKDKVLLEATHAIFGQVATGLIDERGSRDLELLDGVRTLIRPGN